MIFCLPQHADHNLIQGRANQRPHMPVKGTIFRFKAEESLVTVRLFEDTPHTFQKDHFIKVPAGVFNARLIATFQ